MCLVRIGDDVINNLHIYFQNGVAKKRNANQNVLKSSTNNQELSNNDLLSTSQVKQFFGPTSADVPGNWNAINKMFDINLSDNNLSDNNLSDNTLSDNNVLNNNLLFLIKCLAKVWLTSNKFCFVC